MANKTIGGLTQVDSITSATKIEVEKGGASFFGDFSQVLTFLNTYYGGVPTSYTPTFGTNMGTVGSISAYYIRQGSLMWIFGSATLGTVSNGDDVWLGLPGSTNLKTAKLVSLKTKLGELTRLVGGGVAIQAANHPHLTYDSALGAAKLRISFYTTSAYNQNGGTNFNNNEVINFIAGPLPIDEWGA